MIRLGFSSFVLQGGRTGIATYIQNLLQHLRQAPGCEVEVFVPGHEAHLIPKSSSHFHVRPSATWVSQPIANIAWHHAYLPWLTKKYQLDLVHIPSIRRVPTMKPCPLIATVHDLAPLRFSEKYDSLRTLYHRKILTRSIHQCDQILTPSQFTKQDIVHYTGYPEDRVCVIPLGIDHDRFQTRPKEEAQRRLELSQGLTRPFMVYVSRIEHPAKNHLRLIQAYERWAAESGNELDLVLAGADWNGAAEVHQYAEQSSMRNQIKFLGFVPYDTIVDLYNACELMVFPSSFEGFGLPILEAMACGAPVACARTSSLTELAEGQVPLFDPDDLDSIVNGIEEGLELREEVGYSSRVIEYSQSFTWAQNVNETIRIYQQVKGS